MSDLPSATTRVRLRCLRTSELGMGCHTLPCRKYSLPVQLYLAEAVQPCGVPARDQRLLLLWNPLQNAVDDLSGVGKGGLGMGIVRPPQQVLDPNVGAKLDAEVVLLEADEDIVTEEIARQRSVLE